MAKKNNKGFSLIEIVVAIAILTLLVTPIINQLAQTVKVNRRSKLQQYVNDNASKFMEDVKSKTATELDASYSKTAYTKTCSLVDESGTAIANVTYHASKYDAGVVSLGSDKERYTKVAYLDDLPYVVSSKTFSGNCYRVKYDATSADVLSGYSLADDGSIVKYDADGFPTSIVCQSATETINNPNELKIGNMTDLDSSRVAIIPGIASNFDKEAEAKYYSMAMEYLKTNAYETWKQAMLHKENDNVLNSVNFVNSLKKLTKVYINEITVDGKKAYEVAVDIYYYSGYDYFKSMNPLVEYEPYYQVFKMDECPAVYLEYQPFTVDVKNEASGKVVSYAVDDYLMVENYVDGARVYLYKPENDEMKVVGARGDSSTYGRTGVNFYQSSEATSTGKVQICLSRGSDSECKQFDVYTNISNDIFNVDLTTSSAPDAFKQTSSKKGVGNINMASVDSSWLHTVKDDEGRNAKFSAVRVEMINQDKDGYKVILTGAKGDN